VATLVEREAFAETLQGEDASPEESTGVGTRSVAVPVPRRAAASPSSDGAEQASGATVVGPFPTAAPALALADNGAIPHLHAALDRAFGTLAGTRMCAAAVVLSPTAIGLSAIAPWATALAGVDGLYQGFHDDDMVYVGSMQKMSAMYAAFELRSRVRVQLAAALAAGATPTRATWLQVQQDLRTAWQPVLDAAFPPPLPSGFPDLDTIFAFTEHPAPPLPPDRFIDFRSAGRSQAQIDRGVDQDQVEFREWLNLMVRWSNNHAASRCILALSYPYINGVLRGAGLFDPTTTPPKGLWISGNYADASKNWLPDEKADDANAGQLKDAPWSTHRRPRTNFGATARQAAHLMTLIALGKLPASDEMRALLTGAEIAHPPGHPADYSRGTLSLIAEALDKAHLPYSAVHDKIGISDDSGDAIDRNLVHDAGFVERSVAGRSWPRYVVVGLCGPGNGVDLMQFFVDVDTAI
jgi:hypothetical protein